ncbi:MAG: hypothetical protein ACUVQ1_06160 [Candidatus Kapaibacteriales bacterium]
MKSNSVPFVICFILPFSIFALFKPFIILSNEENPSIGDSLPPEINKGLLISGYISNWLGSKKFSSDFSNASYSKEKLVTSSVLFLENLFKNYIGIRVLNLSSLGLPKPIYANGKLGFANSLWNGINTKEPFYKISTFDFYPILMFEKIEVLEGLESLVFSNSDNGLSFNYLTRNFDAKIPYTQIWIGQGGYDFLGSSAVISQNILKNLNAYFSYQRFWSAGRYPNSQSDRWNFLVGSRISINPNLSIKIENNYTNWGFGLNGGVNPSKSIDVFQSTTASVYYQKYKRRIYQNDLNLSYFWEVLQDSSFSLCGNFLLSNSLLNEEKDSTEFPLLSTTFGTISKISRSLGTDNRLILSNRFVSLITGFELWESKNDKLDSIIPVNIGNAFVYGLVRFPIFKYFHLVSGFRYGIRESSSTSSFGTKIVYNIDTLLYIFLEGNYFQRLHPIESRNNLEAQKNILLRLGSDVKVNSVYLGIKGFYRNILNYSIYESLSDTFAHPIYVKLSEDINYKAIGLEAKIDFPIWLGVISETKLSSYFSNYGKVKNDFFPNFLLQQNFKYQYQRGKSIAELGITFELMSPFCGFTYLPQWNLFARSNHCVGWQNNGFNLFANLKLGNAILNLSFNNLLSSNFYYLPIYPEYDRNFQISLIWSFND